jgi:imidazolonepropionase-like amidohydrolase
MQPPPAPRRLPSFALVALTTVLGGGATAADPPPRPVVIHDVTVVDVRAGRAVPDRTVVIAGGVIAAVGGTDEVAVPGDATRIDGRGKFLIPGLWDMHAHVADEKMWPLFLANGVTGVRHMFSVNPLYPAARAGRGRPGGPLVVGADTILDGPGGPFERGATRLNVWTAATPDDARRAVRRMKANGEDFVKVYSNLPREAYFAAADEARAQEMPLVGHVPVGVSAEEAAVAGHRSIEHLTNVAVGCAAGREGFEAELRGFAGGGRAGAAHPAGWRLEVRAHADYDPARAAALFKTFVGHGTWHVPTLVQTRAWATLDDPAVRFDPRVALVPPAVRSFWHVEHAAGGLRLPALGFALTREDLWVREQQLAGEKRLVGAMHRAGVGLLAGTDTPNPYVLPGFALHDELALFVEAGLSPADALRTATLNPARFLGRDDCGEVAAGLRADLVLLERNPLADIRNTRWVHAVVFGGAAHPRADLLRMLDDARVARR